MTAQDDLFSPDPARVRAYEAKQEARRERYEARAEAATKESERRCEAALSRSRVMQGEPIKIGHHSEKRHRRDIERMDNDMRKSCEAADKASHYADKAASVGTAGISSDDPEAIQKLTRKINAAEGAQAHMKAINAAWRKAGKPGVDTPEDEKTWLAIAEAQGISPKTMGEIASNIRSWGAVHGGAPFPGYCLSNNNANIKRMQARLETLKKRAIRAHEGEAVDETLHGVQIVENHDENRLQIFFPGKPSEDCRKDLKRHSFKWSRLNQAWQRMPSPTALMRAREIIAKHYGGEA